MSKPKAYLIDGVLIAADIPARASGQSEIDRRIAHGTTIYEVAEDGSRTLIKSRSGRIDAKAK